MEARQIDRSNKTKRGRRMAAGAAVVGALTLSVGLAGSASAYNTGKPGRTFFGQSGYGNGDRSALVQHVNFPAGCVFVTNSAQGTFVSCD